MEWACKPDSVVSDHFSGMMIAHHLGATDPDVNRGGQPRAQRVSSLNFALLGLAPGGVYHAGIVTDPAVRSYRTLSPLPVLP
ncbi:hypothetical protein KOR42_03550 [Thalassoglobus neptunius]|uniref:Uncharacterized protein n=1 Tax=Thalassoglobus neptunius TaxID=1938619 RepID=A0A5C5X2E5_9PLAN|nr:hypothetical protein KOR42_03550 [Thalassoglobus neptunius]